MIFYHYVKGVFYTVSYYSLTKSFFILSKKHDISYTVFLNTTTNSTKNQADDELKSFKNNEFYEVFNQKCCFFLQNIP